MLIVLKRPLYLIEILEFIAFGYIYSLTLAVSNGIVIHSDATPAIEEQHICLNKNIIELSYSDFVMFMILFYY